jgi:multiple sugar transport system ATP-binding protein
MPAISLIGITKRAGRVALLDGTTLEVPDGHCAVLLGPSGSGKTALLRIVAGLDAPDAGEVRIGGRPVDHLPPAARGVGAVFRGGALYPGMTVAENLAWPLRLRRLRPLRRLPVVGRWLAGSAAIGRRIAEEVAATAEALDIAHLLPRRPGRLSAAQRQRVALARALMPGPAVLLLDEPLAVLDPHLRAAGRADFLALHRRLGLTTLLATRDQSDAMAMADLLVVLLDGRVRQAAVPQTVYDDPADLQVAAFVGTPRINLLAARVAADLRVSVDGVALPLIADAPVGATVTVGVRPEHMVPAGAGLGLPGTVRAQEVQGSETLVHVALPGRPDVVLRMPPADAAGHAVGARLHVRPLPGHVLCFGAEGQRLAVRHAPVPAEAP